VRVKVAVSRDWSDKGCATINCTMAISWCDGGCGWSVVAERRVCESYSERSDIEKNERETK